MLIKYVWKEKEIFLFHFKMEIVAFASSNEYNKPLDQLMKYIAPSTNSTEPFRRDMPKRLRAHKIRHHVVQFVR